jgi:DNA repair exonuclease SbcCD ATPase subunit
MNTEAMYIKAIEDKAARIKELEAERDETQAENVRLQKCIDSIACMLGWMNTPPQDTLEKSISALNARVKELEETEEVLGVVAAEACVSDTFLGRKVRALIGKRGE